MIRNNRPLTLLVLVMVLLGQGAFAFAAPIQHGMCGMTDASGQQMAGSEHRDRDAAIPADGGHPKGKDGAPCTHCSLCSAGHCLAWVLPLRPVVAVWTARPAESFPVLQEQAPGASPVRIYRPPRFSV